jgi:fibronectin-binding autotransporter adhesin
LLTASECSANNGTKSTPCLSADIFGDWREEVIWRTSDSTALHIYTTTAVATNRFYTLMHDPQYRLSIAWQNVAYNQPPHPGFYFGEAMSPPPRAPVSDADLAWRGGSAGNAWDVTTTTNWFVNGIWTNDVATNFAQGKSVLFDLRGSNNTSVSLAGSLTPAKVTVFSTTNYVFTGGSLDGAMKLYKTGSGRLTVSNTNTYTGGTFVSGGSLFVNGTLAGSAVTVERRGTPEGPSQCGGNGRLGQGLTVQNGCTVIVGPGTNSAGTLTVSNNLIELGNVLNLFDLSGDPTGITRTNDCVNVVGNLVLSGTNTIAINQPDGSLGNGVYPLFQYTGTLTGGLTNLVLSGSFLQFVTLTNPPGMIGLLAVVPSAPPTAPSSLTATAVGAVQINLGWRDNSTNENAFLIERSTNNVTFAQIVSAPAGTTNYSDFGLTPNTTYYYRVRGTNLAGASDYSNTANATTTAISPSLTWRGDGTLNVWDVATTTNWLNGTNLTTYADTAFVTFDNTGSNSPAINLSINLYPGSVTVTGTKNYTFGGSGWLAGTMMLTKSGTGTLTISTTNTFSGGIIVSSGTVALSGSAVGGYTANGYVPGSGAITFQGGRFALYGAGLADNTSGYGTFTNDLVIAAGQTGTLAAGPRQTLSSKVSGAGTLNLFVDYVRGDVGGDWSGFTGLINVSQTTGTPPSSTTDDFRVTTTGGFPDARLNIGTNVLMYSRAAAGSIIPIGEFSGALGATVSAGGGSSAGTQNAVTWRVGGSDTDATNAALIQGTTSLIKEGSGEWTLTGTNTYSGTTTVNEGTLLVNGNQGAATGAVTVGVNGALGGTGIIGGAVTVNSGGALAPGAGTGTLTISNNLTLSSGAVLNFELGAPNASDKVVVSGALTLGGTLNVMDLAGFGTNTYTLFTYGGALSGTLPAIGVMPSGYTGSVNTNTSGQVKLMVQAAPPNPPHFNSVGLVGTNLVMSGNGGTAGSNYYVLASTNLLLPLVQWMPIVTNQFGTNGGFNFTNGVNSGTPQKFYLLQVP